MRKISVDKNGMIRFTIIVFIGLALLFGAYSVVAYSKAPITTKVTYSTAYLEKGKLIHAGFFSNDSVYKNGTSLNYYPDKITRVIVGNYTYSASPALKGNYRLSLRTDYYIVSNKKRIYIKNTTRGSWSEDFVGSFSIPLIFNVSAINSDLKEIREGTGLYRASGDTYLLVEVQAQGREPFTQKISLSKDTSGMLHFSDVEKEYKKRERNVKTTVNSLGFLGGNVRVSTARKAFPLLSAMFFLPPLGLLYSRRERRPEDELKDLRKFIVEGEVKHESDPVVLSSAEDLKRVFDMVDRPIVHHVEDGEDVYTITEGPVSYEYRP